MRSSRSPVCGREAEVDDRDVDGTKADDLQRLRGVGGFGDHFVAAGVMEQAFEALSDDRVVVYKQCADHSPSVADAKRGRKRKILIVGRKIPGRAAGPVETRGVANLPALCCILRSPYGRLAQR